MGANQSVGTELEPPSLTTKVPESGAIYRPAPLRPVPSELEGTEQQLAAAEEELFKACLRRDAWLNADSGGQALQHLAGMDLWSGERSASLMRRRGKPFDGPGAVEMLQIHRRGTQIVAVALSSPLAAAGDILWQADALHRTVSDFNVPCWRAMVGSRPAVMMVEEASKHTVLYFYSGKVCLLRCWRRRNPPSDSPRSDTSSELESFRPRAKPGKKAANVSATVGEKSARGPSSEQGARKGRRHKQRAQQRHRSSSSPTRGASPPAAGQAGPDEPHAADAPERVAERSVARWAEGKDLVALLGSLGEFASAFDGELPPTDVRALRSEDAARRKAYHKACLLLHPDRQMGSSAATQALALALFQTLSAAFVAASSPHEESLAC